MDGECDLSPPTISDDCRNALLSGREVHVWLTDARQLELSRLTRRAADLLGDSERTRAEGIVAEETRRDHLAGRIALRLLFSAYYPGVPPEAWMVSRQQGGRPTAAAPRESDAVAPGFSISHNEGNLALAFHATGEPGVDIESSTRQVNFAGLARRYFSVAEAGALSVLEGDALRAAFLRLWTLKEASVKADGSGLAGELARREFLFEADGRLLAGSPDGRAWQYWSWSRCPGWLAVALRLPAGWAGDAITCRVFTLSLPDGATDSAIVADGYASEASSAVV